MAKKRSRPRRTKNRTTLSMDFVLTDEREQKAKAIGVKQVGIAWAAFRAYHESVGDLMADWDAAWRTWCFREVQGFRK